MIKLFNFNINIDLMKINIKINTGILRSILKMSSKNIWVRQFCTVIYWLIADVVMVLLNAVFNSNNNIDTLGIIIFIYTGVMIILIGASLLEDLSHSNGIELIKFAILWLSVNIAHFILNVLILLKVNAYIRRLFQKDNNIGFLNNSSTNTDLIFMIYMFIIILLSINGILIIYHEEKERREQLDKAKIRENNLKEFEKKLKS